MIYVRFVEGAALIALIGALAGRGLWRHYPAFFCFLIAKATRSFLLLSINTHDPAYGKYWAMAAPVILFVQMLALLEIMTKVAAQYTPELRRAKWVISTVLSGCVAAAALINCLKYGNGKCPLYLIAATGAANITDWMSALVMVLISICLAISPVALCRNLQYHRWLFGVYAGLAPGVVTLFAMTGNNQKWLIDIANWGLELTEVACCALWIMAFRESGERLPADQTDGEGTIFETASQIEEAVQLLAVPIGQPRHIPQRR